jgi:hypothetical protein
MNRRAARGASMYRSDRFSHSQAISNRIGRFPAEVSPLPA